MTPEEKARQQIDEALIASGWAVQDYKALNLSASRGVALREVPLKSGRCDYLLLVDRKAIGIVEAKKEGTLLSGAADQSAFYGDNLPELFQTPGRLPFLYESTGVETFFRDERDPHPRSRRVFTFHRPETLGAWLKENETLRFRLAQMPFAHPLAKQGMRDCQIEALTQLEQSFAKADPRALIQMATGAGKTFTACAFIYRLIKFAGAKRVLFLVDRANLGRQATGEFHQFVTPDTGRKFTELYNVQHLQSNKLDDVSRVTVCTIQRLYSMLRGEELPEGIEELSTYEIGMADGRPKDVAYNADIPIEAFDFIVTDECHRSIYNLWRQVLEYFDATLVGLTATPSKQTIGFFNGNLVTEYNHERAVADGVNVGYEVYRIKTDVTERGGKVEKGFYIDKRCKETRKRRWEQLDEDLSYTSKELDRSVVVPSQIRTVLQTFKDALETELFPGREMVPKTLIFAKDDSHAEDIVHLAREVFGKGNDFAKKITYQSKNAETGKAAKGEELIQQFRTSPQLRIAVTVDMIATGTDIKPLECLLFLRDVRSRVYFEQMKGRGTRVLTPTDLQAVSGADAHAKTHFVIVDAVGVCESDKTDSRPLERQPTVGFDKLMLAVALNKRDEDTLTTLAGRLARLDRALSPQQREQVQSIAGRTVAELSGTLLQAVDPDAIAAAASGVPGTEPDDVAHEAFEAARAELVDAACAPFDMPEVREILVKVRRESDQTLDVVTQDTIIFQGFDVMAKDKAQGLISSFKSYLEENREEIAALQILYSRPYRQRLTEGMLKELETKLRDTDATWHEESLWQAFAVAEPERVQGKTQVNRFADLVPIVRFALEQQPVLEPFSRSVQARFESWLTHKEENGTLFSAEQRAWLELIRDHIATTLSIEPDDFDYSPFSQQGGIGRAAQLFGNNLTLLLDELNEVLAA
ncbi:MAG TPA: DEAD/DEAH box helicase family protein [Abditibacteriaceae bacterium]|jgi:type I restriction enzyme R subunit